MTDFTLTLAGPRGDSAADLARRLGLVASTASDTEALLAILNRTVSVVAAATGNVSVSSAPTTIDGVTLTVGDRVLLHAQADPSQNGVWVFEGGAGPMTRWSGADEWHELPGLTVGVALGSTHANTAWTCFSSHGGTPGTTAVTFLKLAGSLNALLSLANTWSNTNIWQALGWFNPPAVSTPLIVGPGYNGGVAVNSGDRELFVGAWAGAPKISLNRHDVNAWDFAIGAAGSLLIREAGTERARFLASGGRMGLGATTPQAKLDLGTDIAEQKLLLYGGPLNRVGLGLGSGELRIFCDTGGEISLGHVSSADGATYTAGWKLSGSSDWMPAADNSFSLGGPSNRPDVVYAATGSINTSDAAEKSEFSAIPDGVKAAARALMGQIGVFQWLAAISRKGEDGARLHLGLKAQDVRDTFLAEGEDPNRWGLFCEDPILAPVEKTRSVERQVTREVLRPRETVTVEGGQAVLRVVEETVEEPVFEAVPLVGADGTPIMREVKTVGPDGQPVVVMEPAMHMAPVMETVEATYAEMEPTGETRLGLRHDQLMMLFIAVMAADRG